MGDESDSERDQTVPQGRGDWAPLADGPNAAQVRYWNEVVGNRWVSYTDELDSLVGPFGDAVIDAAGLEPGQSVLDVGCGCGSSTIAAARRVLPGGEVLGVDVSLPMLAAARGRAAAAGVTNVRFQNGDAQSHEFGSGRYDAVISRFGVMFFADPDAAFANFAAALRRGGRLACVTWQSAGRNPWMLVPALAAAAHLPLPSPPPPGAPGPFSLDDPDRVRELVRGAGLVDIAVVPLERSLRVPASGVDEAVDIVLRIGPLGDAFAEADAETRGAVKGAVREDLLPFLVGRGVEMPGAAWLVTGTRPEG